MVSNVLLNLILIAAQAGGIDLTLVTFPPDSRIDVPLSPNGEIEVRREETISRLEVRIDRIETLSNLDPMMRSYVVWAVSPEGEFENLGELEVDGRKAELDTTTSRQRFGIIVTAEPHFMVDTPSQIVGFRSQPPRDDDVRVEPLSVEVGTHDYSSISLPPQGALPRRITEARMAFLLAESADAAQLAEPDYRRARVALDSMEELLRRNIPMEVLLPYVNDSIRLSAIATRSARDQVVSNQLAEMARRAELLEQQNRQMEQELARLDQRQEETDARMTELQSDLRAAQSDNRSLDLEITEANRLVSSLEAEVARLGNRWPPLRDALMIGAGARETARGLIVTLPRRYFESNSEEFEAEGREFLALLAGIIGLDETPEIRIEGHSSDSGPASRNLTLSEERAEAVRVYLLDLGIVEDNLQAEGFGTTRPIASNDDPETRRLNERVEILFREIRNR